MPTTKLHNSRVNFSVIHSNEVEFLVCTSTVGNRRIKYVENLKTGKRAFPTTEQIRSVSDDTVLIPTIDLDKLVEILIKEVN